MCKLSETYYVDLERFEERVKSTLSEYHFSVFRKYVRDGEFERATSYLQHYLTGNSTISKATLSDMRMSMSADDFAAAIDAMLSSYEAGAAVLADWVEFLRANGGASWIEHVFGLSYTLSKCSCEARSMSDLRS